MLKTQLLIGSTSAAKLYSDDVFSAFTYKGTGAPQTITNGINLSGNGGLVWIKNRGVSSSNMLSDTTRGIGNSLYSDLTAAQGVTNYITSSNSNGFTIAAGDGTTNTNNVQYSSLTFSKAKKFFDIVTYIGDGTSNKSINHSLGVAPGLIIVKSTTGTVMNWAAYHTSLGISQRLSLNTTGAASAAGGVWGTSTPTSSAFYVGQNGTDTNNTGDVYVAYVFAHDTSTDSLIKCGSFTTDGAGVGSVTLDWEPQFILIKRTNASSGGSNDNWQMVDSSRGFTASNSDDAVLFPNLSDSENLWPMVEPTATGFKTTNDGYVASSSTFVYIAIRRSNKPPSVGTQVYKAIARAGTGAVATVTGVGFAPDLVIWKSRSAATTSVFVDRIRGKNKYLYPVGNTTEGPDLGLSTFDMDGVIFENNNNMVNASGATYVGNFFKRSYGVFDTVCYTGNGAYQVIPHSLGVAPELVIYKARTDSSSPTNMTWPVYSSTLGTSAFILLNTTAASVGVGFEWWASNGSTRAAPNASNLYVGTGLQVNGNTDKFVAYLFASKAGISKVGSYTGNGTSLTINAGFTTGARFVMIKRTDSTGDWYVWDSVRGIISANDPHLSLNTTVAEVTTDDSVDPNTTGFIVNQVAATNINVTSATYIYLAFA